MQGPHNRFLRDYQDHMRLLYGPDGASSINNMGDMLAAQKRLTKQTADIENAMTRMYGKTKYTSDKLYAGNVVQDMFSKEIAPAQITNLKRDLRRMGPHGQALWADIEATGGKWINNQLSAKGGLEINASGIGKMLDNDGDKLRALYGPKYVTDMRKMEEVMKLITASNLGSGSPISSQPAILQLSRALLGPLSKKQRFITAVTRIHKEQGRKSMMSVLTDPTKLARFVHLKRMSPQSFAAVALMTDLVGPLPSTGVAAWEDAGDSEMAAMYENFLAQQERFLQMKEQQSFLAPYAGGATQKRFQGLRNNQTAMSKEKRARGVPQ
jgi:hypothetical protein